MTENNLSTLEDFQDKLQELEKIKYGQSGAADKFIAIDAFERLMRAIYEIKALVREQKVALDYNCWTVNSEQLKKLHALIEKHFGA